MKLALRKTAPTNATLIQRIACWIIKARLVSQYCHGGIVIDGCMYHATSAHGLHRLIAGEWTPENWVLIDLGDGLDESAKNLFDMHIGAAYDWLSLLAFVGLPARDGERFYCFEWCWFAMTGEHPKVRVTPEMLILLSGVNQSRYKGVLKMLRNTRNKNPLRA